MAVASRQGHEQHGHPDLWDKFWKDKDGNVVVWQWPNVWLIAWAVLMLVSFAFKPTSAAYTVIWWLGIADLTVWAVLEMWKGVNYLRKTLGAVVLLLVILAIFKVGY